MARALTLALLVCLALGGCGGGNGDRDVTLQLFGDAEELDVYRKLAAAYERKTGERVALIEVPDRDAHIQKLTTSFAGGDPPDVFLVNYRNYAGFADRGVLDPVGPRLERSAALSRGEFYPQPLEAFTFDGRLQCMPQNVSSLAVYYNRDLFRQAGLTDPAADWTFAEFTTAARALTDPPRVYGLGVEPSLVRAAPFVWSAGGRLVDDASRPTRFTFESPEALQGLQNFLGLTGFGPTEQEVQARALEDRFLDGGLAMVMGSRREVPIFRTIEGFDWDVAPFPRFERPAGVLHSDAYCLARGDRADAAWRFVEFAVGPDGARITAAAGRTVPSLERVARSSAFLDPTRRPRSSRVFLDAIPHIRRLPVSPNWPRIEEAVDLALERSFYQQGEAESVGSDPLLPRIRRETEGRF
jgi:multiple sugar transport system substrate-binding protein